jgi:CDP-paratose 2-epimerase
MQIRESFDGAEVFGLDNFVRPGSEVNRLVLQAKGIVVRHADLRSASDIEALPKADWVIDAAANPSVLAGLEGLNTSRQVVEHNLAGTVNVLEYCKKHRAGFILLSTSRVYSVVGLRSLQVEEYAEAYRPVAAQKFPTGVSTAGVSEEYSTMPPLSLYGSTKLASEYLALEYGASFDFPVWINRCGVLAGAGQFGRIDQGIFSFWINAWLRDRKLKCIGFGGHGRQVRDCLHPRDLVPLLQKQMSTLSAPHRIFNLGGGVQNSISLAQLSAWCAARFGPREIARELQPRPLDVPWMVLDCERAIKDWQWQVATTLERVFEEIAAHAENHPEWLELSTG